MNQLPIIQFICYAWDAILYNIIGLLLIYFFYILYYEEISGLFNLIKTNLKTNSSNNSFYHPKISVIGWARIIGITFLVLLVLAFYVWACLTWPIVWISLLVTIIIVGAILALCTKIFGDYDSFFEDISEMNRSIINYMYDSVYVNSRYSPKVNVKWILKWLMIVLSIVAMSIAGISSIDFKETKNTISSIMPEVEDEDINTPKNLTLLAKYPNAFSPYDNGKDLKRMLDEMDTVQIRLDDLSDMTYHQANILINALYAEKGMIFSDKQLSTFFQQCYWYKGKSQNTPKLRDKKKDNWRVVNRYLYNLK